MLVLASILFCLLALKAALPYFIQQSPLLLTQDEWAASVRSIESKAEKSYSKPKASFLGFHFDPNSIDKKGMEALGLSPKQAESWLKYRAAGGTFRKKEDIKKLFFVDDRRYELWEPWIELPETAQQTIQNQQAKAPPKTSLVLNLNHCDSNDLVAIRGIGAFTASKVIRYRNWLGGFYSKSQLHEIKGLRQEQIDTLEKYTQLEEGSIHKITINTATEAILKEHPYIRYKAAIIVRYRQEHGPFKEMNDLLRTGVIDEPLLQKLAPYLDFTP